MAESCESPAPLPLLVSFILAPVAQAEDVVTPLTLPTLVVELYQT